MSGLNLFARLTKVDVAKRLVIGRMTQEVVDKSGEILDYEKSKPHFKAWSDAFMDATDGKSFGNVRAMHGKVAAGKLAEPIVFNDAEKAMDIVARVTDDNEWNKVIEGVYTGFSIGGSYVERNTEKMDGKDVTRYTAKPAEVSLVDNPCVDSAKFFDVIKADGTVEKTAFKPRADGPTITGSPEEVDEFAKVMNDAGLTMKDAIALVAAKVAPPAPTMEKVLADLDSLIKVDPEALKKTISAPEITYKAFRDEALKVMLPDEFKAIAAEPLEKQVEAVLAKAAGAAMNRDRLQAAHDHIAALGASCGGAKAAEGDLTKLIADQGEVIKGLKLDVEKLQKQPMPHAVTLRSVKKEDAAGNNEQAPDAELTSLPFEKMVQYGNGQIDWDATRRRLEAEKLGAAA